MKTIRTIKVLHIVLAIVAFMAMSCSDEPRPQNLEPVIESLDARDITRTEAELSVQIRLRGTAPLSFVKFYYGATGSILQEALPDNTYGQVSTLHLSDLIPGTEYSWYVECGTTTASIKSEPRTFTTIPNNPPAVSVLDVLAYGPTSLIVSFDITDDGGEMAVDAGCEITHIPTGSKSRVYVPTEELSEVTHKLLINGLTKNTLYAIAPFASNRGGTTIGESMEYYTKDSFVLLQSGMLQQLCEGLTNAELDELTISGSMNGDDFRFLRALTGAPPVGAEEPLSISTGDVDIFEVEIVDGGRSYDGSHFTVAGELSAGLFADCVKLRSIVMPSSATIMARDAFARCEALESLDINSEIAEIMPSEGCTALANITVSAGNPYFTSVDGVLFNKDVSAVVWFPLGKTGDYRIPSSITTISENAFYGTKITRLEIPESVTTIGRGAFAGSSLEDITFPDNLANISEGMLQGCASLTTVRLGRGTMYVGDYALAGTSLTDLYVSADIPPYATALSFGTMASGCILHVLTGCKAIYRNHRYWGQFARIVEF